MLEAERRDHRRIARDGPVSPPEEAVGSVFWHPKAEALSPSEAYTRRRPMRLVIGGEDPALLDRSF